MNVGNTAKVRYIQTVTEGIFKLDVILDKQSDSLKVFYLFFKDGLVNKCERKIIYIRWCIECQMELLFLVQMDVAKLH